MSSDQISDSLPAVVIITSTSLKKVSEICGFFFCFSRNLSDKVLLYYEDCSLLKTLSDYHYSSYLWQEVKQEWLEEDYSLSLFTLNKSQIIQQLIIKKDNIYKKSAMRNNFTWTGIPIIYTTTIFCEVALTHDCVIQVWFTHHWCKTFRHNTFSPCYPIKNRFDVFICFVSLSKFDGFFKFQIFF